MKTLIRQFAVVTALAAIVVLGLALAGCGGGGSSATSDVQDDVAEHVEDDVTTSGDADVEGEAHEEGDADADGGQADVQDVEVVASDQFTYDPVDITVTVGQPVRLTLDNTGGVLLHDFTVVDLSATDVGSEGASHAHEDEPMDAAEMDAMEDEPAADEDADPAVHVAADAGEAGVLEFTPSEAGTYVFYCSVEGHQAAGMEGTITVVSD